MKYLFRFIIYVIFTVTTIFTYAGEVHIAVATNFTVTLEKLKPIFQKIYGHQILISTGSTGQLYAQIEHGAPFEVFLAADMNYPQKISEKLDTQAFVYAVGKLILWSPKNDFVDEKGDILRKNSFTYLAIANPRTAPYGVAAQQVIEKLGLSKTLQAKIVHGNSIAHAYQFTTTGSADLGFIAFSQYKQRDENSKGSYWLVPQNLYNPIEQGAILLKQGNNNPAAQDFIAFLRSPVAHKIIKDFGYDLKKDIKK